MRTRTAPLAAVLLALAACHPSTPQGDRLGTTSGRLRPHLPTGQSLDPAGVVREVGPMPLAMVPAPGGRRLILLINGYRQQGVQVVDRTGQVTQTLPQRAAFIGLAFAPDGATLYASGGNRDLVYAYRWAADSAVLADSLVLRTTAPDSDGTRYPAGLALSADGRTMFVAENLADSLAVVDVASRSVTQRLATGPYPYAVAVAPDGTVFVSNWGTSTLSVFTPAAGSRPGGAPTLVAAPPVSAGRHPSALLLSADGRRLFVASGSTDRVTVVDTRTRAVVGTLLDPPPAGPGEGSTPNALALSADGTRLFAAESDANAVAVFDLTAGTAGVATARGDDKLAGRIPTGWFPTAVLALGDTLLVGNGKGAGTGPNINGPVPAGRRHPTTAYTLGQIDGSLSIVPAAGARGGELAAFSARVARANGWNGAPQRAARRYPPFTHVIYVIRENRTYDQVLGDIPLADGDTSLVLFGRDVTPNAHAIVERFGLFDRFFVNAEVSADGHNWSTAAYASDYTQKTTPIQYSGRGRDYDYEGTNRGRIVADDVAEPANGYLWDLAQRAGLTLRNFGEFTVEEGGRDGAPRTYRGTKPFLAANTDPTFPSFDMNIPDQRRADIWLAQLQRWVADGRMPALQTIHLPRDHTSGGAAGQHTPKTMVADNDLALGRMIAALSRSPFWSNTVVFVLEDDAQNGPDHVDSHRSPLLVISAWNRPGVYHRFANTTDVLRTIEEILGLEALSQFDWYGRPLREIWSDAADPTPFEPLTPAQPLDEVNPPRTRAAIESRRFDLSRADAIDDEAFSRVIWMAVKGERVPYPGARRMSALEAVRGR
jgi:YVTN family beta-propeller protein